MRNVPYLLTFLSAFEGNESALLSERLGDMVVR